MFTSDCVRRAPPGTYTFNELPNTTATPPPPKKGLGEQLQDSYETVVLEQMASDVINTQTISAPIGDTRLQADAFPILTPNANGGGIKQPGTPWYITLGYHVKWFFVDAVPIIAKSEPVQEAAHKVVDFTKSAAKATADFAISAAITTAAVISSAVKAVEQAATSVWNWFKSWF